LESCAVWLSKLNARLTATSVYASVRRRDVPDGQRLGPAVSQESGRPAFSGCNRAIRKGCGNQSGGLRTDIGGM